MTHPQHKMAESTSAVSRLDIEGSIQTLFVWTKYDGEVLSLKVSDGTCAWQGGLTIEQLKILADNSKMDITLFLGQTLKALSRKNLGDLSYVYSTRITEAGSLELTWKKHLVSEDIKFQLGSVELIPVSDKSVNCCLLNHSIDCMEELWQRIEDLEGTCKRLSCERQTALKSLQKSISLKDFESEFYGKFKLILNEKKSKIRKLMELKHHLSEQNEEMQGQAWAMKSAGISVPIEEAAVLMPEQQDSNQSTKANPDTHVESLLCDAAFRAHNLPPPAKRKHLNSGAGTTKAEISHPPVPKSSGCKTQQFHADTNRSGSEMSTDSNELLDML